MITADAVNSAGTVVNGGNLTRMQAHVTPEDRWRLMQQRGMVVWLTGLSGAGKSTLAMGLDARLHALGRKSFVLDGDHLRHGLCRDLGFTEACRMENIRRAGEAAKLLAQAGLVVICSFISPFHRDRQRVRESCRYEGIAFAEVFVNAPLRVCEQRDSKGLYKRARAGEIRDFTGISSPYEEPKAPEVLLCTNSNGPEACVRIVLDHVLKLSAAP